MSDVRDFILDTPDHEIVDLSTPSSLQLVCVCGRWSSSGIGQTPEEREQFMSRAKQDFDRHAASEVGSDVAHPSGDWIDFLNQTKLGAEKQREHYKQLGITESDEDPKDFIMGHPTYYTAKVVWKPIAIEGLTGDTSRWLNSAGGTEDKPYRMVLTDALAARAYYLKNFGVLVDDVDVQPAEDQSQMYWQGKRWPEDFSSLGESEEDPKDFIMGQDVRYVITATRSDSTPAYLLKPIPDDFSSDRWTTRLNRAVRFTPEQAEQQMGLITALPPDAWLHDHLKNFRLVPVSGPADEVISPDPLYRVCAKCGDTKYYFADDGSLTEEEESASQFLKADAERAVSFCTDNPAAWVGWTFEIVPIGMVAEAIDPKDFIMQEPEQRFVVQGLRFDDNTIHYLSSDEDGNADLADDIEAASQFNLDAAEEEAKNCNDNFGWTGWEFTIVPAPMTESVARSPIKSRSVLDGKLRDRFFDSNGVQAAASKLLEAPQAESPRDFVLKSRGQRYFVVDDDPRRGKTWLYSVERMNGPQWCHSHHVARVFKPAEAERMLDFVRERSPELANTVRLELVQHRLPPKVQETEEPDPKDFILNTKGLRYRITATSTNTPPMQMWLKRAALRGEIWTSERYRAAVYKEQKAEEVLAQMCRRFSWIPDVRLELVTDDILEAVDPKNFIMRQKDIPQKWGDLQVGDVVYDNEMWSVCKVTEKLTAGHHDRFYVEKNTVRYDEYSPTYGYVDNGGPYVQHSSAIADQFLNHCVLLGRAEELGDLWTVMRRLYAKRDSAGYPAHWPPLQEAIDPKAFVMANAPSRYVITATLVDGSKIYKSGQCDWDSEPEGAVRYDYDKGTVELGYYQDGDAQVSFGGKRATQFLLQPVDESAAKRFIMREPDWTFKVERTENTGWLKYQTSIYFQDSWVWMYSTPEHPRLDRWKRGLQRLYREDEFQPSNIGTFENWLKRNGRTLRWDGLHGRSIRKLNESDAPDPKEFIDSVADVDSVCEKYGLAKERDEYKGGERLWPERHWTETGSASVCYKSWSGRFPLKHPVKRDGAEVESIKISVVYQEEHWGGALLCRARVDVGGRRVRIDGFLGTFEVAERLEKVLGRLKTALLSVRSTEYKQFDRVLRSAGFKMESNIERLPATLLETKEVLTAAAAKFPSGHVYVDVTHSDALRSGIAAGEFAADGVNSWEDYDGVDQAVFDRLSSSMEYGWRTNLRSYISRDDGEPLAAAAKQITPNRTEKEFLDACDVVFESEDVKQFIMDSPDVAEVCKKWGFTLVSVFSGENPHIDYWRFVGALPLPRPIPATERDAAINEIEMEIIYSVTTFADSADAPKKEYFGCTLKTDFTWKGMDTVAGSEIEIADRIEDALTRFQSAISRMKAGDLEQFRRSVHRFLGQRWMALGVAKA